MKENTTDKAFFDGSNQAFLGTANASDEILREVSPALNVTENTPPVYLWATAADPMVPVQHSLRMAHAWQTTKFHLSFISLKKDHMA